MATAAFSLASVVAAADPLFTVHVDWSPPAPPPVGAVGNGTCGATSYGGDCDKDERGAWDARQEGIANLTACAARARGCARANYVSFSLASSDCSWYAACDMGRLCADCSTCGIGCPSYVPYASEVLRAAPPAPPAAQTHLFAMPIVVHDAPAPTARRGGAVGGGASAAARGGGGGARKVLLVSRSSTPMRARLSGDGVTRTVATVIDGSVDGVSVDAEPGFVAPVERMVGADGALALGPYAVALVDAGRA